MIDLATAVSVRIIDHQGERAPGIFPVDRQRDIRGSRCLAEENSLRLHGLIDQPVVYQDRHIGTFIKRKVPCRESAQEASWSLCRCR